MSKLTINLTGQTVQEESQGGNFDPIPAGTYAVTIFDVEQSEFQSEANKGKPYLKVQLRIAEGEYANRRLFENVPLFLEWGSGADAFKFYDFFGPVQGQTSKDFRASVKEAVEAGNTDLDLPTPEDLMGKELEIKVKVVPDKYNWNLAKQTDPNAKQEDFNTNEVQTYLLPSQSSKASSPGKFKL